MESRVIVHAVGISFQHLPQIRRKVAFIFRVDGFPDPEKADEIVRDGGLRPLGRGELAADRQRHLLDRAEIVFGMGKGHAEWAKAMPNATSASRGPMTCGTPKVSRLIRT